MCPKFAGRFAKTRGGKILFPAPIPNKEDVSLCCKENSWNWNPFPDMGTKLQWPRFAQLPFLIVGISRLGVLLQQVHKSLFYNLLYALGPRLSCLYLVITEERLPGPLGNPGEAPGRAQEHMVPRRVGDSAHSRACRAPTNLLFIPLPWWQTARHKTSLHTQLHFSSTQLAFWVVTPAVSAIYSVKTWVMLSFHLG